MDIKVFFRFFGQFWFDSDLNKIFTHLEILTKVKIEPNRTFFKTRPNR